MNVIEALAHIVKKSNDYLDLNLVTEKTIYVTPDGVEVQSIDEAFTKKIDLSKAEKKVIKETPKNEIIKMLGVKEVTDNEINIVIEFLNVVKELDSEKEYKKLSNRLNNYLTKARHNLDNAKTDKEKEIANKKIIQLQNERIELNNKFGKTSRKK